MLGILLALAAAWLAVDLRQRLTAGPDAQASAGMYAAGDAMLGVAVFCVLALAPLALALFWLRPVNRFWIALTWGAGLYALTGFVALAMERLASFPRNSWMFVCDVRIGTMPLSSLALVTCGLFAPQLRQRGILLASGLVDGLTFVGVVLVKFVLPQLGR